MKRKDRTKGERGVLCGLAGLASLSLGLLLPVSLEAQSGSLSDVSGAIISGPTTGGTPSGSGAPPPSSTPEGRGALASTVGNFEAGSVEIDGVPLPPVVQEALAQLFAQGGRAPSGPAIAESLSRACQSEGSGTEVQRLLDTMDILVRVPSRSAVSMAIAAFNALVAAAPESCLRSPPAEFHGIRAGLLFFRAEVSGER